MKTKIVRFIHNQIPFILMGVLLIAALVLTQGCSSGSKTQAELERFEKLVPFTTADEVKDFEKSRQVLITQDNRGDFIAAAESSQASLGAAQDKGPKNAVDANRYVITTQNELVTVSDYNFAHQLSLLWINKDGAIVKQIPLPLNDSAARPFKLAALATDPSQVLLLVNSQPGLPDHRGGYDFPARCHLFVANRSGSIDRKAWVDGECSELRILPDRVVFLTQSILTPDGGPQLQQDAQSSPTRAQAQSVLASDVAREQAKSRNFANVVLSNQITSIVTLDLADLRSPLLIQSIIGNHQALLVTDAGLVVANNADIVALSEATDMDVALPTQKSTLHYFVPKPGGSYEYVTSHKVKGSLLNQFTLHDAGDWIYVVTTDRITAPNILNLKDGLGANFYVFKKGANEISEAARIESILPDEIFTSARLFDDRAFLVTYKPIYRDNDPQPIPWDPLIAIDLKEPTAPAIKGTVELEGTATHLAPYGENKLVAVGPAGRFSEGTTAVTFFDVDNLATPTILQRHVFNGFSDAVTDYQGLHLDSQSGYALVPLSSNLSWSGVETLKAVQFDLLGQKLNEDSYDFIEDGRGKIVRALLHQGIIWVLFERATVGIDPVLKTTLWEQRYF